MTAPSARHLLRSLLLPLVVLGAGVGLTWTAVVASSHALDDELAVQFSREADLLESEATRRLLRAEYGASSLRATYAVEGRLTDAGLKAYVANRSMDREFPGVRGFSVIERVPRVGLAAFVARQQAIHPGYAAHSTGSHGELLLVRSTAPLAGNEASLGLDVAAEANRRDTASQAVDTGQVWMTPSVRLAVDPRKGWGWVQYAGIYAGNPRSIQQRRDSLVALVSVGIVADEILAPLWDLAGSRLRFRLRDGSPDGPVVVGDAAAGPAGALRTSRSLLVGNRLLTLQVESTPAFHAGSSRAIPWMIGAGGALVGALLALLTWLLVTGRSRALELAAERGAAARRLATIVERTAGAVFTTDLQGRLTWGNRSFEAFTGTPHANLLGADMGDVLGLGARLDDARRDAIRAELAADRTYRMELDLARGGVPLWVEVALGPERADDGRLVGAIGISLDVTARKQAELRLQAREHMLRLITDNIPVRISYWDADLRCLFANARFSEVFGHVGRPVVGCHVEALLPPETWRDMAPRMREALAGMPQQFEQALREADGRVSSWQLHLLPDQDGAGGLFVLGNEITDLKTARDQALDASQAKTRFLSNMSHEIRTPMNAVMGMLSLLCATPLSERQADYAAKAEGAARSLLSLLNDVLDFSKIEAGKMQLDCRPFSLEQLLADLSVILSANVADKELEVLYELDPRVPDALVGDDMRLRQILINLGGNAVKFTATGEVVVATRLVDRDEHAVTVEFSVRDTGIGISASQQEGLFGDYAQATGQTARQYGGTGLGLGICRRLTELMDSRLELASEPGRGSRFWFAVRLPVQPGAAAAPAARNPARVLVVDDNDVARAALCGLAASLGWQVDSAAGGEAALATIAAADSGRQAYDAVFVDWRMPGLDGWETSLRIRALPAGTRTPLVVMVTAQGREMLGQRPRREQSLLDGFLVKPVTAAMLRDVVERAHVPRGVVLTPPPAEPQVLAGLRLLVAEDNPVNQQIARELLSARGAEVEVVANGRLAVEAVGSGTGYDALLMDMLMPEMDGLAATVCIRQQLHEHRLPIIAMTANAMDSDRDECLAAGMDDHVGKPVAIDQVVQAILRHVPGRSRPAPPAAQAAAAVAAGAPMLDRPAAIERLGGNVALFERLLPVFRSNLLRTAEELRAAVAREALDESCRVLHTIKGMAGTLGAMPLARLAADAEGRLRAGSPTADPSVDRVLQGLAETLDELGGPAAPAAA